MQEGLIAFKYLENEHDGERLSKAMIEVLEDLEIAPRLLGVTADNASNNTTMMAFLEQYYQQNHPQAAFSVNWNQVECMAHVINLAALQILKNFKQPVDSDNYDADSDSSDKMVTAVSRLSFLVRKIRRSPKIRRLMAKICKEKEILCMIPIIDVQTRWNSTYDMLVRAIKIKDIISDTIYGYKDNLLIALLLDEQDWECIQQLVEIMTPLKEVTLLTSRSSHSLCIASVIPLYSYCTDMLLESMSKFDPLDDIHIGMQAALEKLNHYYDKVSPMVGISLLLNPTMKKDSLLSLGWKPEWIESVSEHFSSAFLHYKEQNQTTKIDAAISGLSNEINSASGYSKYKRMKFLSSSSDNIESEQVR